MMFGNYQVIRKIAEGGMTIIWEVENETGEHFACKNLKPLTFFNLREELQVRASFQQEARLLIALSHPNIVKGFDYFTEGADQFFVMELLEGDDLESLVAKRGRLKEEEAIDCVRQIASALSYLHRQNPPIVHRDLKPSNCVHNRRDGKVKILDLGIAKTLKPTRRKKGDVFHFGTPPFAPPEQYEGFTDLRSDVYSLGAMAYFLLTGQLPPEATDRLRFDTLSPPSQLGVSVCRQTESTLMKALELDPSRRWQNIDNFVAALPQHLKGR